LSFPAVDPANIGQARLLGDIVLSFETVAREAAAEGKPLADHYRHLVVHGFLHLIGFDHETDVDARRMEESETRILARLGVADPYRASELVGAAP
jgi:probable rRNA maturation factor